MNAASTLLVGLSALAAFAQEIPLAPLRQYSRTRPSGEGFVTRLTQPPADAFVFDLRIKEEFDKSHAPGARNLTLRQLLDPPVIDSLPRTKRYLLRRGPETNYHR